MSAAPRDVFHIERFLLNLLAELLRERDDAAAEGAPDWLAQACRAIRERENFSGGVERFLALCGRSREHAARTVRQLMGTTPTAYVNGIRMTYARRQLEMGDREILDIALDCGLGKPQPLLPPLPRARRNDSPRLSAGASAAVVIPCAG